MEIGNKMIKMNWKYRIISAIGTAVLYIFLLWSFDYFSEEKLYSINGLIFQGVFFGIFSGIGFPYIIEKATIFAFLDIKQFVLFNFYLMRS